MIIGKFTLNPFLLITAVLQVIGGVYEMYKRDTRIGFCFVLYGVASLVLSVSLIGAPTDK